MNGDTAALRLQALFEARPDEDIPFNELYTCAKNDSTHPLPDTSEQQRYVGVFVSRLNQRFGKVRIKPGEARRTYRLYTNL